jgi:hypothetical protein
MTKVFRYLFWGVTLTILFLACSSEHWEEPSNGYITGTVSEAGSDQAVAEAMVFLTIRGNVVFGDTVFTDSQGDYVHGEWPGSYFLNVEKDGYREFQQIITLKSDDTLEVDVELIAE